MQNAFLPHRPLMSGRIPELLENLKVEFESMAHDVNMFKMQRDECDRKIQNQLGELTSIQNTLYELERAHNKIKRDYEDEILRLRRQLSEAGVSALPTSSSADSGAGAAKAASSNGSGGGSAASSGSGVASVAAAGGPAAFFSDASKRPPGPPPAPFSVAAGGAGAAGLKRGREDGPFYAGAGGPGAPFLNLLASGASALEPLKNAHPPASPATAKGDGKAKDGDEKAADKRRRAGATDEKEPRATSPTSSSAMATEMTGRQVSGAPGADWIVGYNPQVQTNLNIDLAHSIDHPSVVCCVRFSADGKYLATGCNRSAQVYDVQSGEKLHVFTDENAKDGDLYIRSVCFSPDGKYLAAGAEDKTVKLWDIATKRLAQTFVGHDLDIYSLDFSADERFIVSGSGDKKAKLWDVEKGKCLYTLGNDEVGPKDGVTSVAISPDGRLIAAGSLDRIVRLWDATTGYFLERYEGHLDSVYSVAFSPDGKSLASGSLDKTLKLWDLSSTRSRSRCRSTFNGHKDFVLSVAFSADGNWLVSGSKDRSVQFWDPRTAVTHMMLQGHRNSVISVALNPKGGTFATGSGDCRARMWKFDSTFPQGP